MKIRIVSPEEQGKGEFDGGKIKEQKPIGFSGEGSIFNRLGPLFYWAWGHIEEAAGIGEHPHKGFEILTYVLGGKSSHRDSLGTNSVVGEGGVQVMQTGSGMWHAEGSDGPGELFQIWLEPHLSKAVKREPVYAKYTHEQFPLTSENGVTVKTILGEHSPIQLVTDAIMVDVDMEAGASHTYSYSLGRSRIAGILASRGGGTLASEQEISFAHKDFIVVQSEEGGEIRLSNPSQERLRFSIIDVPAEVDYPLYNKPR
ncbi:hypothetical protein SAMN04487969_14819 [Paenibacillus algorifonticola]|uniref:Pirin N-terminal domain-containing protein n=1 Tax=Paenibacillus algorifonticola TaxID=684063 RepID=A0A1I2IZE6_9BACL|nr:pirin family protein [Paenibacillus algorifonticola]SFF47882.1 hypothetical protein SAMN04487969_14819 [Paenibacillus algorifonticola]